MCVCVRPREIVRVRAHGKLHSVFIFSKTLTTAFPRKLEISLESGLAISYLIYLH